MKNSKSGQTTRRASLLISGANLLGSHLKSPLLKVRGGDGNQLSPLELPLILYERKVNRQTFFNVPDFVRVFTHRDFACLFAVALPLISVKQPTKSTKLVERYHQKSGFKTNTFGDLLSVRIVLVIILRLLSRTHHQCKTFPHPLCLNRQTPTEYKTSLVGPCHSVTHN